MESERSEFVVVYGRRRIGKTFLVRRFFKDNYAFSFVGKHEMRREQQLAEFAKELMCYSHSTFVPQLKNWTEAFDALQRLLETYGIPDKKVVFLMKCLGWTPPNQISYRHWKTSGMAGLICVMILYRWLADQPHHGWWTNSCIIRVDFSTALPKNFIFVLLN